MEDKWNATTLTILELETLNKTRKTKQNKVLYNTMHTEVPWFVGTEQGQTESDVQNEIKQIDGQLIYKWILRRLGGDKPSSIPNTSCSENTRWVDDKMEPDTWGFLSQITPPIPLVTANMGLEGLWMGVKRQSQVRCIASLRFLQQYFSAKKSGMNFFRQLLSAEGPKTSKTGNLARVRKV